MGRLKLVFRKSILFILGLIFSYKLVEKLFFNILITHLSEDLHSAAIVVNLQGGISSVLTIIMAIVAEAYVGLFKMLFSSCILCITGLVLIHVVDYMFYPALLLMTLSEASRMVTLESFLGDQLVARDQPASTADEEERREKRTEFWMYLVSIFAALVALFWPLKNVMQLTDLAKVLAIVMGGALIWFLLGFKLYNRVTPTGSALSDVAVVITHAIINRNVASYPQSSSEQLHQNPRTGDAQIMPHVSWLRWVDRAAVVQENRADRTCSVRRVKRVKYLLKMVPMWLTFIPFSLVYASGDTFFLQEASSIITDHDTFSLLLLTNLQRLTELMVSVISHYLVEKLKNYINEQKLILIRIGIGMLCCVLCCIAARIQTVHRLDLVDTYGNARGRMNVYRLTPQFLLLGFMGGLSSEGLQDFFLSQVSRSMSRYGPWLGECVMGIGKFVSIVCIIIFSKWCSRPLDKYYLFLAILSSVNIVVYCFVAWWYGDDKFAVVGDDDIISEQRVLSVAGNESFPPPSRTRTQGIYRRYLSMP